MSKTINVRSVLTNLKEGSVVLPTIQRGFVWKAHQIENLWDSMLRGYPVGAFTVQEKDGKKSILDGQQRLTALALGFGIESKVLKTESKNYKMFIDLYNPQYCAEDDSFDNDNVTERIYNVRVITNFQPWGYRFNENEKTLESHHIDLALNFFKKCDENKIEKLTRLKSKIEKHNFPYDSYFPVPLDCFLNLDSTITIFPEDEVIDNIKNWICSLSLSTSKIMCDIFNDILHSNFNFFNSKKDHIIKILNDDELNSKRKKEVISNYKNELLSNIPTFRMKEYIRKNIEEQYKINNIKFYEIKHICEKLEKCLNREISFIKIDDHAEDSNNTTDVEHIFERLNRGGTPITLEELNYSLFKSKLSNSPEIINIFEKECQLISPAKFLPIMFRLFQHSKSEQSPNQLRIKSKDFKRDVLQAHIHEFSEFLKINTGIYLKQYETIMLYSKDNTLGLPYPLLIKLVNESPELIFMTLYRIFIKKNPDIAKGFEKKIIILTLCLYWFFGGYPRKLYPQLLNTIFPAIMSLPQERFYSCETLQRAMYHVNVNNISDIRNPLKEVEGNSYILNNRDFLLYAQRKSISTWFGKEFFDAKDINRPFDYDHILPSRWVKRKKYVHKELRDIYNTNGNLRAWPYWLNRGDQDKSPSEKLNSKNILKSSFCDDNWIEFTEKYADCVSKKANSSRLRKIIDVITKRNAKISQEFFNSAEQYLNLKNFNHDRMLTFSEVFRGKIELINDYWLNMYNTDEYEFGLYGSITTAEDEKLLAFSSNFYIYISKNYLQKLPTNCWYEGDYIFAELVLVSLSFESFGEFLFDIYSKLRSMESSIRGDLPDSVRTDLSEIFKDRIDMRKFKKYFI